MVEPAVKAVQVTVYMSDAPAGKRRRWFTKAAAYRSAAISRVNAACGCGNPNFAAPWERDSCDYCSRIKCEKRSCENRQPMGPGGPILDLDECGTPEHTYRYRLVGRLARWLAWRDAARRKQETP